MIQSLLFWEVLFGAVVGYWLLLPRLRDGFLFLVSAGYLATLAPWSVVGLIGLTAVFKLLSPRLVGETRTAERILVVSVLAVSASLAFFKFAPPILTALHGSRVEGMVLVPLGISYYSFKLIHYAVEVARENIEPAPWDTFLAYMFLFPTFTAGPIERYDHLLAHRESRLSRDMVVEGGTRIVIGLIKTGFVSELVRQVMNLGIPNNVFLLDHLATTSTPRVWLVILRTYVLVYLGFSGYTDVAIGASRLFGIGIMENFNFPIFARSISEYWSRWHMSLSRWCQAYVYMPTLARARSPYLALNASFFVMGMWHSGTITRLLWGLWHAWGSIAYMVWSRNRRKRGWTVFDRRVFVLPAILITQLYVLGSWAILVGEDSTSFTQGLRVLAKLAFINLPQ